MDPMRQFRQAVGAMAAPIKRRVMLMVGRAVVKLVDDTLKMQELQIDLLAGETRDGVERFQQYGFTSNPHPQAEALAVFVGGNRAHGIVIAVDDRRYRLKELETGEVGIYTDEGDTLIFRRDNNIEMTSMNKVLVTSPDVEVVAATKVLIDSPDVEVVASTKVLIDAPDVTITGDLQVDGTIDADGSITSAEDVLAVAISLLSHQHSEVKKGHDISGPPLK